MESFMVELAPNRIPPPVPQFAEALFSVIVQLVIAVSAEAA
jgi:hypothetical protein